VGQRCATVAAENLGSFAALTRCAPARRPNVEPVWSKHCEVRGGEGGASGSVVAGSRPRRRDRIADVRSLSGPRRASVPDLASRGPSRALGFVATWGEGGTHRAGLRRGLLDGHAFNLHVAVPATRGVRAEEGDEVGSGRGSGRRRDASALAAFAEGKRGTIGERPSEARGCGAKRPRARGSGAGGDALVDEESAAHVDGFDVSHRASRGGCRSAGGESADAPPGFARKACTGGSQNRNPADGGNGSCVSFGKPPE